MSDLVSGVWLSTLSVVEGGEKMTIWKLKNCPRCGGDTFIEKDVDGWIERCLLCGHSRELVEAEKAVVVTSGEKK